MASFVRPNVGAAGSKSIRGELTPGVQLLQLSTDKYCKSLLVTDFSLILKNKDGEALEDTLLKSGQRAYLSLGTIAADKYHLLLIPNSELSRSAYIGAPLMIEPYTEESFDVMLKVEKAIDLKQLQYLFRIYIVD
jgi:hypothetical protein